eukprot:Nk52_evm89s223 gene=Nk52_evmTU89s223
MGVESIQDKQVFTWEELAGCNTASQPYVAYHGKVYDLTKLLAAHPGGEDVLLYGAGKDVTPVFDAYHPLLVSKKLAKYEIGTIQRTELPSFPVPSKFYSTLKSKVYRHFRTEGKDPKLCYEMFARYAVIFFSIVGLYMLQMSLWDNVKSNSSLISYGWLSGMFTCSVLSGIMCALVGLMPLHDASHFAVTNSPLWWKIIGASHDFFNGASYLVWVYQHTFGHHPYTNIDGADPDVDTLKHHDVRRIKWTQPWYYLYQYQHIYVPVLYAFLAWKTRLQDIVVVYITGKNGPVRVNPLKLSQHFQLLSDAVTSYWLALSFQANHVVNEVSWPLPNSKTNVIDYDWAEMQVLTTQDYDTTSYWITFLTGGLNHQVSHHLFPAISQGYYRDISPFVKETCKEFGIPYYCKSDISSAIGSHIDYLKKMGVNKTKVE